MTDKLTDAHIEEILRSMQARVDDAWGAAPIDPATVVAAFTELAQLRASDKVMREALEECSVEDFEGSKGISIYAAAANELSRRTKLARAALSKESRK